jgi:hypothetical protein
MFSNSGCFTEIAPTVNNGFTPAGTLSCTADTRVLIEGTFGIWFKPYDGSREKVNRGRIQWGPQFSYVDRNTWSGVGALHRSHEFTRQRIGSGITKNHLWRQIRKADRDDPRYAQARSSCWNSSRKSAPAMTEIVK